MKRRRETLLVERKTKSKKFVCKTIIPFIYTLDSLTPCLFSNYQSVSLSVQILAETCKNTAPLLITTTDSLIDRLYSSIMIVRCSDGQRTPVVFNDEGEEAGRKRIRMTQ